jgi:secreted trypsin-like serine protease
MRRTLLARWRIGVASLAATLLAVTITAAPAHAITYGELDGYAHPYVGFMIAKDAAGKPLGVCSGTLLSPTVFLTAGHCVQEPAVTADIWFKPDLTDPVSNNLPNVGDARGTTYTHPDYDPSDFTTRDVGVVVLEKPFPRSQYGALPTLNQFDAWQKQRGLQDAVFTTVGYGVQKLFPDAAGWKTEYERLRMVATPRLVQMDSTITGDYSMIVSASASTGGACRGDSGGPNFVGTSNVIGGLNSYDPTGLCRGNSGIFRMDRPWALDWVNSVLAAN